MRPPAGIGLWRWRIASTFRRARAAGPHRRSIAVSCAGACAFGALLAFACFYNFGRPQFWNHAEHRPLFVHATDMRIYQPFAKYFDELRYDAMISDATWQALSTRYSVQQVIEVMYTASQYQLVSMALNSLGVQLDPGLEDRFPKDVSLPALATAPKSPRLEQPRVPPLHPKDWTPEQRKLIASHTDTTQPVLNLYSTAPLWRAYFEALGVNELNIVFSDATSEELWAEGARYGSIDPCFPSKVAQAHIHNLLYRKHVQTPLDFVCEEDVRRAIQAGLKLVVSERAIVTPAARDLGEANRVFNVAPWRG